MSEMRDSYPWPDRIIKLSPGSGKTGKLLFQYKGIQVTATAADHEIEQGWIRNYENDSRHEVDCYVVKELNYLQTSSGSIGSPSRTQTPRITPPPGLFIGMVADFFCSSKTCELVVKPMLADMQHEYFEALSQGREGKARLIRARYLWNFCIVLGLMDACA